MAIYHPPFAFLYWTSTATADVLLLRIDMSGIGVEADIRLRLALIGCAAFDPSLHLAANFAVMHNATFPTTMWVVAAYRCDDVPERWRSNFSTLLDDRRTMFLIEPLAQSEPVLNSCFSDW